MGRLLQLLPLALGPHLRHRTTRASRHPTTKVATNHNHDQQHQRRAVFRARQSVSPIRTDQQG